VDEDRYVLVMGYMCAVADRLVRRDIVVRALRADGPNSDTLGGILTLGHDHIQPNSWWAPTRLRREPDSGWSATLLPSGGGGDWGGRHSVARYLPGQLVPAPDTVALFVAALNFNPNTVWAAATLRRPHAVDRRWLPAQLGRFASPEPP
jgi:hypothetical protein